MAASTPAPWTDTPLTGRLVLAEFFSDDTHFHQFKQKVVAKWRVVKGIVIPFANFLQAAIGRMWKSHSLANTFAFANHIVRPTLFHVIHILAEMCPISSKPLIGDALFVEIIDPRMNGIAEKSGSDNHAISAIEPIRSIGFGANRQRSRFPRGGAARSVINGINPARPLLTRPTVRWSFPTSRSPMPAHILWS